MTTSRILETWSGIVADLSRHLSAGERYERLLQAIRATFPCDATALLRVDGDTLRPVAIHGLSRDTLGRRFRIDEHPRLARILRSTEPVRFAADSDLPDPYDGLVDHWHGHGHGEDGDGDNEEDGSHHAGSRHMVHDCMGTALYIDDRPWGVLTLDAMIPGVFDAVDAGHLRAFVALAAATVKAADRIDALEERVERVRLVNRSLLDESGGELIGDSQAMNHLRHEIDVVAGSDLSVLITGETGVGKELVARAVHMHSPRTASPLVQVNCAALPRSMVESELFGHVQGAFSGATSNRRGKFELADQGTLFLDEVGELPLAIQATLLRVLQSGEIQRVGSDDHIRVDVRVIAATNRDLAQEVAAGRFRPDLYHRLAVYPMAVAPLRERGKDVALLAGYFLERNRRRLACRGLRLSRLARSALQKYAWPGNVRELEHVLGRAALKAAAKARDRERVITIDTDTLGLTVDDTDGTDAPRAPDRAGPREPTGPPGGDPSGPFHAALPVAPGTALRDAIDDFQRELITARLAVNNGNWAATARSLGLDRSNLYRLATRLGLK